jgi:hypothetical protein
MRLSIARAIVSKAQRSFPAPAEMETFGEAIVTEKAPQASREGKAHPVVATEV